MRFFHKHLKCNSLYGIKILVRARESSSAHGFHLTFCEQLRNTIMDTWDLPLWREQIVALAESQGIMDHLHHNFMLPPSIPTKSSAKHTSNGANGIVCSFVGSSAYSQKNLNLSACSSTWTRHTRSGKWQALQEDYLKSAMRGNSS